VQLATINIQSRPLRLVYLVDNRDEILDAVKFYTHLWGGFANAIFPIPRNEKEVESLKFALSLISPDFVLSSQKLTDNLAKILEHFSSQYYCLDRDTITEFTEMSHWTDFQEFPHIIYLLNEKYPTFLQEGFVNFCDPDGKYSFEIALQEGILSQTYDKFLRERLKAQIFNHPQSIEQLIKTNFVLAFTKQALWLSKLELSKINTPGWWYSYYKWIRNDQGLYLFLDNAHNIEISCDYWNSGLVNKCNKILLPQKEFLENLDRSIDIILEIMPFLEYLYIITSLNMNEANDLAQQIKASFNKKQKDIHLEINYRSLKFNLIPARWYGDQPIRITQMVIKDNSIRFAPVIPSAYRNRNYLFGYDAEIYLDSGKKLFIPAPELSLTLKKLFYNPHNLHYNLYNTDRIRSKKLGAKNLTGITSIGEECKFYIPLDEDIIKQFLKDKGLELRINEHTRYAKGFIKHFGGILEAPFIIDKVGVDILRAFVKYKSDVKSLEWCKLQKFLGKECQHQQSEITNILDKKIPEFLEKALIFRGYSPDCPSCNLVNFYPLDRVKEFNECQGCGESFLLPLKSKITYKLNELASKLFETGGLAVLMTLNIFSMINCSSYIQLGGGLLKEGESKNFAEIDLFWLTEYGLTIVECKSIYQVNPHKIKNKIQETCEQLKKIITEVSPLIAAKVVVLSMATDLERSSLEDSFKECVELGKKDNIKIHLLLNWELFLEGEEKVNLTPEVIERFFPCHHNVEQLNVIEFKKNNPETTNPQTKPFIFNQKLLEQWRENIVKQ
jgi:hypothetical protein